MSDEERMSLDSPEARAEYAAWKAASPRERAEVQGVPCEHPDSEDGRCLECGEWVYPFNEPT